MMFAERRKTLLLALVACVQLVLAPALRPTGCGGAGAASGGGHGCCAVRAPETPADPDACCCGHEDGLQFDSQHPDSQHPDASGPTPRGCPDGGREPGDDGGRCHCVHAPQPWAPDDDGRAAPNDPAPAGVPVLTVRGFVEPSPPAKPWRPVGCGLPGRAGPALHVLYCVFLI